VNNSQLLDEPATVGREDEVEHRYCCDENLGWCGADLSASELCLGDCTHPLCSLCMYAEETYRACACQDVDA
jgi:hypothetical protein